VSLANGLGQQLETYFQLLATWNRKINLTGLNLDDPSPEAFDRLLIEPLVAAKHIPQAARQVMDVGSGGGSPAIPLALAVPAIQLLMVESKTRKAVFLREVIRALALTRADVATSRFEELLAHPALHEAHDLITVRAIRIEARLLMGLQAFLRPGGWLLLFRGPAATDPAEAPTPPLAWKATFPLVENLRSRLVIVEKRPIGR
jgi:16S rRNA (guanine527-N7)-methyltransferase